MIVKNIRNFFLSLLVLLLANNSHLDQPNIDANHNNNSAVQQQSTYSESVDSLEKSDHNFFSPTDLNKQKPINKNTFLLSDKKVLQKCTQTSLEMVVFSYKRLCPVLFPNLTSANDQVKFSNHHKNLSQSNNNLLLNFSGDDKLKDLSSQEEITNQSDSSDSLVNDIMLIKTSPVSSQEMLSFDEWRRKISEQMEQSKITNFVPQVEQTGESSKDLPNTVTQTLKLSKNRARNFASYECGAKIADSNSEADFVNRVLNEQMDEYMLNPCKTKNWFVVELCETIQPQYLEIANYELYSSVPKEFVVYASENYPNRNDWSLLGTFTANDMRTVQSFKLHNNGFVKYLKIELLSYYGSEHFCPISLIRVFGTSLFDEVERIDKPESKHVNVNIATEGESAFFEDSLQQPSFDIVGNAKKAVYNIVMKAFKFDIFNRILENFSLKNGNTNFNMHQQSQLIHLYPKLNSVLFQCEKYFFSDLNSTINVPNKCLFFRSSISKPMFDMLYTQYLIRKYFNNQLFLQCTLNGTFLEINTTNLKFSNLNKKYGTKLDSLTKNLSILSNNSNHIDNSLDNLIEKFNVTHSSNIVLSDEAVHNITIESSLVEPTLFKTVLTTLPLQSSITSSVAEIMPSIVANSNESIPTVESKIDTILPPPLVEYEPDVQSLSSSSGQSKEAVIIRLTNRIKNLEKNISLMSTYLESLSVRYRMQMEEMQSIFNKTIDHLNNTAIRAAEKDLKQQEFIIALEVEITNLKQQLYSLSSDHTASNWLYIQVHIMLMLLELTFVSVLCFIFYVVFRRNYLFVKYDANISKNSSSKSCDKIVFSPLLSKKQNYRSKSLPDINGVNFSETIQFNMKHASSNNSREKTHTTQMDCDINDKENCQNNNPLENTKFKSELNSRNCLKTHSFCVNKILKVIN